MAITVTITDGPTTLIDWKPGMNAQQALEAAWVRLNAQQQRIFTYELQYFGDALRYMVVMINDTHETYSTEAKPNYFWEFYYNGKPATSGVDHQELSDGDEIRFSYESEAFNADSTWKTAKATR